MVTLFTAIWPPKSRTSEPSDSVFTVAALAEALRSFALAFLVLVPAWFDKEIGILVPFSSSTITSPDSMSLMVSPFSSIKGDKIFIPPIPGAPALPSVRLNCRFTGLDSEISALSAGVSLAPLPEARPDTSPDVPPTGITSL